MRLVFGHDLEVAQWAFERFNFKPTPYVMAIGIINNEQELQGAAVFQEYNGSNVELAYYGPGTFTSSVARTLAKVALEGLHVSRVTVRTQKKNKIVARGMKKFGFVYEGIMHKFYGSDDAVVFGLYGNNLAKLAGVRLQ